MWEIWLLNSLIIFQKNFILIIIQTDRVIFHPSQIQTVVSMALVKHSRFQYWERRHNYLSSLVPIYICICFTTTTLFHAVRRGKVVLFNQHVLIWALSRLRFVFSKLFTNNANLKDFWEKYFIWNRHYFFVTSRSIGLSRLLESDSLWIIEIG